MDAHTLVLLFGMMIVAGYLRLSGFFGLVTLWAIRRAQGPRSLLAAVIAAAGVLSALFVNDVVCLVLAPLIVTVTRRLGLPPVPYLIALAAAANVGSVATLTGNPQNMLANLIVVEAARSARIDIGFLEYCKVGVPLTLVTLAIGWLVLVLVPV